MGSVDAGVGVRVLHQRWAWGPDDVCEGNNYLLREEFPMPATPFEFVACWRELREKIAVGIEEWRLHHPKATLQEIEAM